MLEHMNLGTSISQDHEKDLMDLIDRQEAIDALYEQDKVTPMTEDCLEMLLDRFEALPSAQPEIIRCKDCKYAEESDEREWLLCHWYGDQWNKEDHWCSHAERRTDG